MPLLPPYGGASGRASIALAGALLLGGGGAFGVFKAPEAAAEAASDAPVAGGAAGDQAPPRCRSGQALSLLPALYDHWEGSGGDVRKDGALELATCLIALDLPHSATVILAETAQGASPEASEAVARAWLPLELELGPDLRADGPLAKVPLPKVHRRSRSDYALLQNLLRMETGAFAAAAQGLAEVGGAHRGVARLLMGQALEQTQAPKDALAAYHSALSGLGEAQERAQLIDAARATRADQVAGITARAKAQEVADPLLPKDLPLLPLGWLVPDPHLKARMGLGRAALEMGEPEAARAYLSALLKDPVFGQEAHLVSGRAAIAEGALATSLTYLEPLSRQGTLLALRAQLVLRALIPETRERALLYERSRSLSLRLEAVQDRVKDTLGEDPAQALAALRAQDLSGEGPLPAEVMDALHLDLGVHLLRRRLQAIEIERAALRSLGGSLGNTSAGRGLWERLRQAHAAFSKATGDRILGVTAAWSKRLGEARGEVPPADIRDALFSPFLPQD